MAKEVTEEKTEQEEVAVNKVSDKNGHTEPEEKTDKNGLDEKADKNGDGEPDEKKADTNVEDKADENNDDDKPDEKTDTNGDAKSDEKADKNGDGKENEGSDDASSSEELGLLDKPVEIITTKRDRKSTERFTTDTTKEDEEKKEADELDYSKGKGSKIADIEYIKHMVNRADSEDLKVLHKLMYNKTVKITMIKRNIRQFCGYPYDKGTPDYKKVCNISDRLTVPGIRWINGILGLEKSSDKEQMKTDLLDFLAEPKDLGMPIPVKTPGKPKKKRSKGRRPGKRTPKRSAKNKKTSQSEDGAEDDADEEEDEDEVSSASDDSGSEDEDKEEEDEKPKKSPTKKPSSEKKSSSKKKKPTAVKISVPGRKSKTPKRKSAPEDSSDDDEPLVKKPKNPPTNPELKKIISTILKDVDLEEVTMKTVVRLVYDKFPDFDLTHKKDFIKTSVKELIS